MTKRILPSAKELAASLNMPKTSFPLRPDHSATESIHIQRVSTGLYRWQKETRHDSPLFQLQDGPPFANGDLHIGHALNKILKDILIRYKLMTGHQIRYEPGWDCHGLPIELKAMQKSSSETSTTALRSRCKSFALEAISRQKEDMLKWGLLCDPQSDTYLTMSPEYEARQLNVFATFVERGLIKVGTKPVHWSPSSRTALAEAELEYVDDHISTAVYARYPVVGEDLYLLIWSTTPWTLPANKAIAINPSMEYVVALNLDDQCKYIVANSALDRLPFNYQLLRSIEPSQLQTFSYSSPFNGHVNAVITGNFVGEDTGTGLVHIAPAYGMDDYNVLPEPLDILNDDGTYSEMAPEFLRGQHIHGDGSKSVIDYLTRSGHLIHSHEYSHRVPVDWRTKKPVIQRATRQLFISITSEIKEQIGKALSTVEFHPASGRDRLTRLIDGRREWCISRQRKWGVPIPIFYNIADKEPLLDSKIIRHVASLVESKGSDCWWEMSSRELLPQEFKHLSESLVKGEDTMDVWFDSGTAWSQRGQADVYLEGSDQFRGWFQSSLITSIVSTGNAPFKRLVSHGFVVDAKGNKMSKSIGNIVAPSSIIAKAQTGKQQPYGIDLLRAWVASTDFTKDVSIGNEIIQTVAETQQKIRNTCRFMIGNLSDFDPEAVPKSLWTIDKLMMSRTMALMKEVKEHYDNLAFTKVMSSFSHFCSEDLSAFYYEIIKDRLYSDKPDSESRKSAQFALRTILSNLTRAFAPVLMILAEEIYQMAPQHFFQNQSLDDSIFHLHFPTILPTRPSGMTFEQCRDLRNSIQTAIKNNGLKPVQTCLNLSSDLLSELKMSTDELVEILGVSKISTQSADGISTLINGIEIHMTMTNLHKCPRCWMHYSEEPDSLCPRCDTVLNSN